MHLLSPLDRLIDDSQAFPIVALCVVCLVTGPGASNANTAGGQVVSITGSSFGPPSLNAVTSVTYGHIGTEYTALACAVQVDSVLSSQMTCVTANGTGAGMLPLLRHTRTASHSLRP